MRNFSQFRWVSSRSDGKVENSLKSAEISHRPKERNTQDFSSVYFNLLLVILSKFRSLFYTTVTPYKPTLWGTPLLGLPVIWTLFRAALTTYQELFIIYYSVAVQFINCYSEETKRLFQNKTRRSWFTGWECCGWFHVIKEEKVGNLVSTGSDFCRWKPRPVRTIGRNRNQCWRGFQLAFSSFITWNHRFQS